MNKETCHWNAWVEGPKSMNIENAIRKYCVENNITIKSLYTKDNPRDLLDKLLSIRKETVYFELQGDYESLSYLQSELRKKQNENE